MRALLFSGGVESTSLAFAYRPDILITIDYGQVCAEGERRAATHIAGLLGLEHRIIEARLAHLGSGDLAGAMTNADDPVPEHWPYRNQMLATIAVMACADCRLTELMIGTVRTDRVHADGHEGFVRAMSDVLASQTHGLKFTAPALALDTLELVMATQVPRDLLGWTFSCHRANFACGRCRGCEKSRQLFEILDVNAEATS